MDSTLHDSGKFVARFRFPILSCDDVVESLKELDISLSRAELEEPLRHKEKFRQAFVALVRLECVWGIGVRVISLYLFLTIDLLMSVHHALACYLYRKDGRRL
jgi:hypothetical protein